MQKRIKELINEKRLKRVLYAAVLGNLLTVLAVALSSVLIWKGTLPEDASREILLGSILLGSMLAGALSAGEGGGALTGFMGGCGYILIMTVIGLYRAQTDYFDLNYIRFLICIVSGSGFGGIISTGKKNKKRVLRRKRYTISNH